jgi:hypothetical protein
MTMTMTTTLMERILKGRRRVQKRIELFGELAASQHHILY